MKEQDYINIKNLTHINTIKNSLREMMPDHKIIDESSLKNVMAICSRWEIKLFAELEGEID